VVCDRSFPCPPSDKTVTCSKECSIINHAKKAKELRTAQRAEVRRKISAKAKDQGHTDNLRKGTLAALKSPNSGRFETNINAKEWMLISPEGKKYYCHNLTHWARSHCELFGFDNTELNSRRVSSGLRGAKRGYLGKKKTATYKGWQVIPPDESTD